MAENEEISGGVAQRFDSLRRELEQKIDACKTHADTKLNEQNTKIGDKLGTTMFFSIISAFLLIVAGIFTYLVNQLDKLSTKFDIANEKIIIMETKNSTDRKPNSR